MTTHDTASYPRSFPVSGPLALSLRLGSGHVSVTAADVDEATVDLRPARPGDPRAIEIIAASRVELGGRKLVVHVPEGRGFRSRGDVLVEISLPTGSTVTAEVGSADLEIAGTVGALDVQAGSGDVTVGQCGDATVRSGSGDVQLAGCGAVSVSTGSGDIEIERATGDLRVKTGSGDVRVVDVGADGRIGTGSGDIELHHTRGVVGVKTASGDVTVRRAAEGEVSVDTASGDVMVGVASGTVTRLDCSSVTGQVHSDLSPGDAPEASERRLILNAKTVTGRITVNRVA